MSQEKRPERGIRGDKAQQPQNTENRSNEASLSDRLGASASGLLQSLSGHSAPRTISSDLGSLHASTSKGYASSSSGDRGTTLQHQASSATQAQNTKSSLSQTPESFRTRHDHDASDAQNAFDDWSRSSVNLPENDVLASETSGGLSGHIHKHKGKAPVDPTFDINGGNQKGNIVESDGAAVTSILSQPSMEIDAEPSDGWDIASESQEPDVGDRWLTNRSSLDNVVKPTSSLPKQPKQYELIPNFWNPNHHKIENDMNGDQHEVARREILMASESSKPWLDILNRYQDEVWGDMLPLVREAREEVKTSQQNKDQSSTTTPLVGPAVRRLQMVLRHMKTSQN